MTSEIPQGWKLLFSEEEAEQAVACLVVELLAIEDVRSKGVVLIQVLQSATVFAEMIRQGLVENGVSVAVESVEASSYVAGPGQQSSLRIVGLENVSSLGEAIRLVVDDMVDTGATMEAMIEKIGTIVETTPIFSVVLLQKIKAQIKPDFLAIKKLIDEWVAGTGINGNDLGNLGPDDGRNVPGIIAKII